MAFISNAIFGSYLNRYYSDVLGWTDSSKFGIFSTVLPMVSVIFVIAGNLVVGRLIDNTRTQQGKARPYMFLSTPFVCGSYCVTIPHSNRKLSCCADGMDSCEL